MSDKNALILGHGYTAKWLVEYAKAHLPNVSVLSTSRSNPNFLSFDLARMETWRNLPQVDFTFWTFPASPFKVVQQFLSQKAVSLGKVVVIGTTGAFYSSFENDVFNEESAPDTTMERVLGEQEILRRFGIVVYASGIYGPDRNPIRWIEQGRVTASPKKVNLIHVEDLSQILWKSMLFGKAGTSYIACDSAPFTWDVLFDLWKGSYQPITQPQGLSKKTKRSKIIDASKTLEELGIILKYRNVLEGVASLA